MFFRFLQSVLAGLGGGAILGAALAGLHSAAPGGSGVVMGLVLGGLTGGVLGLAGTLVVLLVIAGIRSALGRSAWSAARWRWSGFAIGAAIVTIVHVVDIYIL